MDWEKLDYDDLKKRGFLRSKENGLFVLRARGGAGNYSGEQLNKLADIARRFGRNLLHATTRQGIEIPYIPYEKIEEIERELKAADILTGTSGPRLRPTTCCPGNNWCKRGLVDTFKLYERIEKDLGFTIPYELPHKFKIVVSGCPNACTRAQQSEVGLHGKVAMVNGVKVIGYTVYLGGCGGLNARNGFKLDKVFSEDEVLKIIDKVVHYFKANAKPRQRLCLLIDSVGREKFLVDSGVSDLLRI